MGSSSANQEAKPMMLRRHFFDENGVLRTEEVKEMHIAKEELEEVLKLDSAVVDTSEQMYAIHKKWLFSWLRFVSRGARIPGPISNHRLLNRQGKIKRKAHFEDHWRAVNAGVWGYLSEKYGGGPAITIRNEGLVPLLDARAIFAYFRAHTLAEGGHIQPAHHIPDSLIENKPKKTLQNVLQPETVAIQEEEEKAELMSPGRGSPVVHVTNPMHSRIEEVHAQGTPHDPDRETRNSKQAPEPSSLGEGKSEPESPLERDSPPPKKTHPMPASGLAAALQDKQVVKPAKSPIHGLDLKQGGSLDQLAFQHSATSRAPGMLPPAPIPSSMDTGTGEVFSPLPHSTSAGLATSLPAESKFLGSLAAGPVSSDDEVSPRRTASTSSPRNFLFRSPSRTLGKFMRKGRRTSTNG